MYTKTLYRYTFTCEGQVEDSRGQYLVKTEFSVHGKMAGSARQKFEARVEISEG